MSNADESEPYRRPLSQIEEMALDREKVPSFERYPFSIPAIREFESLRFESNVTFFVGENGSGKSTLLEAIAVALGFNAEGGSRNFDFATRPSHSTLHECLRISRTRAFNARKSGFFYRAESFYNVASEIERLDVSGYGDDPLHERSHGEAFLQLVEERFWLESLFLLDEPEAALSPARQLTLLVHMDRLVKCSCQFIVATHSPILLAFPGASIYAFSDNGIDSIAYEHTEAYTVTKAFLTRREQMLRELLPDD